MTERTITLHNDREAQDLFGRNDEFLRRIEQALGLRIVARNGALTLAGESAAVERGARLFDELMVIVRAGQPIRRYELEHALKALMDPTLPSLQALARHRIDVPGRHRTIAPKTPGQQHYVEALGQYDIVFAIGPAGTGKTYLAMARAVAALTKGEVSRIILARPAVEAGESLGFLPGDLTEKITPYLRPLYDALYDMLDVEKIQRYVDRGIIELAPLAYMRGRTLNDSFVILDEAQNTTAEQMKMFLTRLGFDSRAVITGDVTQVDLPGPKPSGLIHAQSILQGIEGLKFVYLTGADVVRHELVQQIIKAYEVAEQHRNAHHEPSAGGP